MSLAQILSTYMNLNLLILVGFFGLGLFSLALKKTKFRIGSGVELRLHYTVLLAVLGFSAIHPFLPRNEVFAPAAKFWSAPSIKNFGKEGAAADKGGYLILPTPMGPSTLQADQVAVTWSILGLALLLFGGVYFAKNQRVLINIKRRSFPVRELGKVRILVNDEIQVPFSYWLPGQANVVLPSTFLARRQEFKMAMAHEIQHHRHGDTRWVYVMWGLKLVCIINPAIYLWNRWISEIQEFACDETLVDQNKVESQAYARCLVEVAQTAIDQRHVPVCATGLTFLVERHLLYRRIERMFSQTTTKIGRSASIGVGLLITAMMGVTAYASNGLVQDRRVSMDQAKAMAIRAQSETGFPVVVNDLVLKQLNRYIGTPEGRQFMRDSLARMENYKTLVGEQIRKYGLPEEIMALPLIESGYQNLPESRNSAWPTWKAAGVWQFVRETARNYGLVVNEQRDDRLNVELETDAAMRYLQSNYLRFKDWPLATLAYNMGENAVQKGMNALGSKDAWTLIRKGYQGDKDYLPKLMAAILIMKNPDSVR